MTFRELSIGGFEVGPSQGLARFVDDAYGLVGSVFFIHDGFALIAHDGEEGVIEVGCAVGQIVAGNREQFLVGVGEDVEPWFIGDFSTLVADVEEGG